MSSEEKLKLESNQALEKAVSPARVYPASSPTIPQSVSNINIVNNSLTTQINKGLSMPPAQELAGYEAISPGLASRAFAMAESSLQQKHALEQRAADYLAIDQKNENRERILGMACAFTLSVLIFGISYQLLSTDKTALGCIFGAAGILPLIQTFFKRRSDSKADETKPVSPAAPAPPKRGKRK